MRERIIKQNLDTGVITSDEYRKNGRLHRDPDEGPAAIYRSDDDKEIVEEYYVRGMRHRIGGPARTYKCESKEVIQEEYYHRGLHDRDEDEGPQEIERAISTGMIFSEVYRKNSLAHRSPETAEDPKSKELLDELRHAETPEQIAAVQAKIDAHKKIIQQQSGWSDHVRKLPPKAQAAGTDHGNHLIEDELKKLAGNDPALLEKLKAGRSASEEHADKPQTPEQIQKGNQALLDAAGHDPKKRAAAQKVIDLQAADRVAAEKAKANVAHEKDARNHENDARNKAKIAGSEEDDAFGPPRAVNLTDVPAAPPVPDKKAEASLKPGASNAKDSTKPNPHATAASDKAKKKEEPKKIVATPSGRAAGPVYIQLFLKYALSKNLFV